MTNTFKELRFSSEDQHSKTLVTNSYVNKNFHRTSEELCHILLCFDDNTKTKI